MNCYFTFCEQYAAMAKSFYSQYHQHQENAKSSTPSASIAMEQAAICAVIFQALAVESYVNLFGSVVLGDDVFRCRYESEIDKKHRASTIDKIKNICNVVLRHRLSPKCLLLSEHVLPFESMKTVQNFLKT